MVENLPTLTADDGGTDNNCPTEIATDARREAELSKVGLMALLHRKNTDFAAFLSAQSLRKPAKYHDPDATASAELVARLPYLFAACGFAHYLKCIVRERSVLSTTATTCSAFCRCGSTDQPVCPCRSLASEAQKARKPLAAAHVAIEEVEGQPSQYAAGLYLRPQYQLEESTVSLRLTLRLPQPI